MTGVVLCGGSGTRLGGAAKALLTDDAGRTLLAGILEAFAPQVDEVVISTNDPEAYGAFGHRLVADAQPGLGPLAGILAAARIARHHWLCVLPGDAPGVPPDLVQCLWQARLSADTEAVCGRDACGLQPLHLLVATARARTLQAELDAGTRSVRSWLRAIDAPAVSVEGIAENINTPADLARWRAAGDPGDES